MDPSSAKGLTTNKKNSLFFFKRIPFERVLFENSY